jgi:TetR/AcrR family tetracycline transcriptional repressor
MSFSKLSQSLIVDEALTLLREEGIAQLSLRKVAARLGVRISSLYWHVRSRNHLYALLCERIIRSCLDAVPESQGWEKWLHGFGMSLWDAQIAIPDVRQLIIATVPESNRKQVLDQEISSLLEQLGLHPVIAGVAQQSVQSLVTGWNNFREKSSRDTPNFKRSLEALITGWKVQHATESRASIAAIAPEHRLFSCPD